MRISRFDPTRTRLPAFIRWFLQITDARAAVAHRLKCPATAASGGPDALWWNESRSGLLRCGQCGNDIEFLPSRRSSPLSRYRSDMPCHSNPRRSPRAPMLMIVPLDRLRLPPSWRRSPFALQIARRLTLTNPSPMPRSCLASALSCLASPPCYGGPARLTGGSPSIARDLGVRSLISLLYWSASSSRFTGTARRSLAP